MQRGSELTPGAARPARLHSLCSSAALVVNVFGYWRGRDQTPLLRRSASTGRGGTRLTFEEPLPTGLAGDPPTVDVALYRPDGRCVAIESKFAEWLVPRPRNKRVFKDKYFRGRACARVGGRRLAALPGARRGAARRPRAAQAT